MIQPKKKGLFIFPYNHIIGLVEGEHFNLVFGSPYQKDFQDPIPEA